MHRFTLRVLSSLCSLFALGPTGCVLGSANDGDPDAGDDDGASVEDGSSSAEGSSAGDESGSDAADESSDEGTPIVCPVGNGPTEHQDGATDQVWAAEDSPHVIPFDMTVTANIVIEPCSVVQLGGGITVTIADGGSIEANGEAGEGGIRFEQRVTDDPWTSIRLLGGTMALEHAVLDGGGFPGNGAQHLVAAVLVRGRDGAAEPDGTLSVRDVVISSSHSNGVRIEENGAFTADSDDLVIVGATNSPITTMFDGAGSIPAGDYTGNGTDVIILTDELTGLVAHDMTLFDRGVPYLVGAPEQIADLRVDAGAGGLATLTIEAGVEMQFRAGGVFRIDPDSAEEPASGALVAIGTEDEPIVFTSFAGSPAAGDWLGLTFGSEVNAATRLEHVRVEFAGGEATSGSNSCPYPESDGINEAAIRILGAPTSEFITNTEIVASANHGIDRGWRDDVVVDFTTGNTFDVRACRQTVSRTDSGVCPDPVPCD